MTRRRPKFIRIGGKVSRVEIIYDIINEWDLSGQKKTFTSKQVHESLSFEQSPTKQMTSVALASLRNRKIIYIVGKAGGHSRRYIYSLDPPEEAPATKLKKKLASESEQSASTEPEVITQEKAQDFVDQIIPDAVIGQSVFLHVEALKKEISTLQVELRQETQMKEGLEVRKNEYRQALLDKDRTIEKLNQKIIDINRRQTIAPQTSGFTLGDVAKINHA